MPRTAHSPLDHTLAQFVKHAYAHAPAIQKIFDAAHLKPADIQRVADLARVPITTKDRLVELQRATPPFGGFLAVEVKKTKRIFQSPGPLYEPRGSEKSLDRTGAKVFRIAGFKRGDLVLNTLSYHLSPGGWILDGALQALGAVVIPSGVGNTELQVKLLTDLQINGYAGTPSFLMTIFKKAEELGIDVQKQFALAHALFTGEPYPPSLRAQFENNYRLKTTSAYATAELGFLAYDCAAQQGMHFVDDVIIQICDANTGAPVKAGEAGQVVVTTFNETYPLIRFGTGDLAMFLDAPCACGRTSPRLQLVGRVGDAIKVRGMFVHPNQLKAAIAKFPAIARAQAVITRPDVRDQFVIKVELGQSVVDCDQLAQDFSNTVRDVCRVSVDQIDYVPAGAIAADAKLIIDERKWE